MRAGGWILAAAALASCDRTPDPPAASCSDPARGPRFGRFRDVTASSGVDFGYAATGFQGGGLAVADLDGDGRPDLVAARREGGLALFHNRGGLRFSERRDTGLDRDAAASALAAADLDNDGDRDLVIATAGLTRVFDNRGDAMFDEVARLDATGTTEHVLPADLDGDGLLDLYLGNYDLRSATATRNQLYLQRGRLGFVPAGAIGGGLTWSTTAFDVDDDGDQDLYVANDTLLADFGRGGPPPTAPWPVDLLLRNDGRGPDGLPRFTDVAAAAGLAFPRSSMGGTVGDFDDDGQLDLYVPDFGANDLLVRSADGRFVERAGELGVAATERHNPRCAGGSRGEECLVLSWSAALADFDLDGREELLLVNGETTPGDAPPVLLFTRGDAAAYAEVAPEIPCMDARGLVVSDLDGDGDPDVIIAQQHGPLVIYENRGAPARTRWLGVVLRGRASNRDGLGAVIALHHASGRVQTRAIGAGGVIHSSVPAEAWFGLGAEPVDRVEVRWPSGRRSVIEAPPTGRVLRVDEGE